MQFGFYFDQSKCIGCFTCSVACKDWNNISPGDKKLAPGHCIRLLFTDIVIRCNSIVYSPSGTIDHLACSVDPNGCFVANLQWVNADDNITIKTICGEEIITENSLIPETVQFVRLGYYHLSSYGWCLVNDVKTKYKKI